jgi:hypothetical protein
MKRLLVSLAIYCFFLMHVCAQVKPAESFVLAWNSGNVIFKSGDTLHCKLRYNHAASVGMLQILENDIAVTLTPADVNAFSFYDEAKQKVRNFSSLPAAEGETSDQPFFMESLYSDQRFSIVNHRTMDVPYGYMNYTRLISKPVKISKKYILDSSTGELLPLSKENALRLMDTKRNEVTGYIQSHRLKFKKTADYIHLFRYHSSL